jgi:hypothetical protein
MVHVTVLPALPRNDRTYPIQVRSLLEFVDSDDDLTQEELEDDSRDFLPNQKDLDVAVSDRG